MPRFPTNEPPEILLRFLTDALDEVDIGILLLDRDMRVRFVNRRQADYLDLPPAALAAGPTLRDLLNHYADRRWYTVPVGQLPEYLDMREAEIRAGSIPPVHIDLRNGVRLLFSCHACPDGGRILTYTDMSREARPETLDALAQINAELRFSNETMEDHAAHLASLAEQTDESARKAEEAKQELQREIAERRELEARLRHMATTDGLTGALNRVGFLAAAQVELDGVPRPDRGLAMMMLDVDFFKSINDRYGHAGGDRALRHLVTLLGDSIRRGDLLGRLGGEEFAVLLSGIAPPDAERIAERLVARIAATPVTYGALSIGMTVSVGLTFVTAADSRVEPVVARADDALYRAKESGRNKVVTDRPVEIRPVEMA